MKDARNHAMSIRVRNRKRHESEKLLDVDQVQRPVLRRNLEFASSYRDTRLCVTCTDAMQMTISVCWTISTGVTHLHGSTMFRVNIVPKSVMVHVMSVDLVDCHAHVHIHLYRSHLNTDNAARLQGALESIGLVQRSCCTFNWEAHRSDFAVPFL